MPGFPRRVYTGVKRGEDFRRLHTVLDFMGMGGFREFFDDHVVGVGACGVSGLVNELARAVHDPGGCGASMAAFCDIGQRCQEIETHQRLT